MEHFTAEAEKVLDLAENIAMKTGSMLESVHLLVAITEVTECTGAQILKRLGFDKKQAESYLVTVSDRTTGRILVSPVTRQIITIATQIADKEGKECDTKYILLSLCYHRSSLASKILSRHHIGYDQILPIACGNVAPTEETNRQEQILTNPTSQEETTDNKYDLEKYGEFLTDKARRGELEPFYGREEEIERVLRVLSRKNKNNPILVGESGVGKTAIVEGVAGLIANNSVPAFLKDKEIFSLNVSAVVSGTRYRGDLEEKTDELLKKLDNKKIIVFIDEIHTLLNSGNGEQSINLSSLLKPALTGRLTVIGATTFDEYRKYIEKDSAFERRFTKIIINEMSESDTEILLGNKKTELENYFNIKIDKNVVTATVSLSSRYIKERFLPDKAIDLIEETCAKASVSGKKKVTEEDVKEVLAENTGLPVKELTSEDRKRILITVKRSTDSKARITVSDTGVGITVDEVDKIFQPGVTAKPHGIGMGLVIVTELLNNYDCKIATILPGEIGGATFEFEVPLERK